MSKQSSSNSGLHIFNFLLDLALGCFCQRTSPRLVQHVIGFLIGLVVLALSCVPMFLVESSWIHTLYNHRSDLHNAPTIDAAAPDTMNHGKIVCAVGMLGPAEHLEDPDFRIAADGIILRRRVWMYQWRQKTDHDDSGTTYEHVWSEELISSSRFSGNDHRNPPEMPIASRQAVASQLKLGEFRLAPELLRQIQNYQPCGSEFPSLDAGRKILGDKLRLAGNEIYRGDDPKHPQIGDLRIAFDMVPAGPATVLARQNRGQLEPWDDLSTFAGCYLRTGTWSRDQMLRGMLWQQWCHRLLAWAISVVIALFGSAAAVLPFGRWITGFSQNGEQPRVMSKGGMALLLASFALGLPIATAGVTWMRVSVMAGIPLIALAAIILIGGWHFRDHRAH